MSDPFGTLCIKGLKSSETYQQCQSGLLHEEIRLKKFEGERKSLILSILHYKQKQALLTLLIFDDNISGIMIKFRSIKVPVALGKCSADEKLF